MVGAWWASCSSSPGATKCHQEPASLSCSVVKLELNKCWKPLVCLVILVFAPSFKRFLTSSFVPMLCTIMLPSKGQGKCCVLQKQKGDRWKCGRTSFQIASRCAHLFCLLPCLIAGRRPALQSAGNCRPSPWFSSCLQCGCHSSVSHLCGTGEASLGRGKRVLIHLAWVAGMLAAKSRVCFSSRIAHLWPGLWVSAEHVRVLCRIQLDWLNSKTWKTGGTKLKWGWNWCFH